MSLLSLILALVVLGLILYLVNTYIPMDRRIKQLLNIAVIIFIVVWLLQAFGVIGSLSDMHIR